MTEEITGDGLAQEDAAQDVDERQDDAPSQEADEAEEVTEGSPHSDEGEAEAKGEKAEAEPEGEAPEPERLSKSQRRRQRQREYVQSLEEKIASLESERERMAKSAESDTPPSPDDFESDVGYEIAAQLHKNNKKQSDERLKELDSQLEQERSQVSEARQRVFAEQMADARTKYKDFDQVALYAPISDNVAYALMDSDLGAEIAYYLGKNPAKARELSALRSSAQLWKEIGALETRVAVPSRKQQKPTVPDPVKPVKGGGGGKRLTPETAGNYEDYRRARMKQMQGGA